MVFLCAAELFVRRAAAGVFFRRAVECSFIELRRVRSSSCCRTFVELLSDFRRAAVRLSSSCCPTFVELRRVRSPSCCRTFVELQSGVFFGRAAVGVFFGRAAVRDKKQSKE